MLPQSGPHYSKTSRSTTFHHPVSEGLLASTDCTLHKRTLLRLHFQIMTYHITRVTSRNFADTAWMNKSRSRSLSFHRRLWFTAKRICTVILSKLAKLDLVTSGMMSCLSLLASLLAGFAITIFKTATTTSKYSRLT